MKNLIMTALLMFGVALLSTGQEKVLKKNVDLISYENDKDADVKRLFVLMKTDKVLDGMMNNMVSLLREEASLTFGDASKDKLNKYIEFLMSETRELSNKLINTEMVEIYNKHFTHSEIKDMIAFYESPTGKKMVDEIPAISNELMDVAMAKYLPAYQERLKNKLEELR